MKNYLTEWKKFKNNILNEGIKTDAAKREIDLATKLGQEKLKNAQAEDKAQEEKEKAEAAVATAAKTGTTGTTSTIGTVKEADNQSVGGQADGTVGATPGDHPDKPNLKVSIKNLAALQLDEKDCGMYEGVCDEGDLHEIEMCYDEMEEEQACGKCPSCMKEKELSEAKYQGRSVPLNKPMRGDVKKFKVYVKDPSTGNIKKVNFGDKKMRIKKSNPKRRKSFRARHRCENPGPKTKARYWSCRKW